MKIKKDFIIIFPLFFILIAITTFPLLIKVNTYLPAFFSTDESYGVTWNAWFAKFSLQNNLSLKNTDFICYPFGISLFSGILGYIFFVINYSLAVFTNPVLTYNLQVILNLFLSALFAYNLVSYLAESRIIALFSALIFGFSPYIFMRSWQHLGETYLWQMPLFLWLLFRLKDENTLRIKLLFILSFIVTTINFDVTYYTCIILGLFLLYLLIEWKENLRYIKKIISLMLAAFTILIPQFFFIFKNILNPPSKTPSAFNPFYRPFEDLFAQSVRPLSYFLPSVAHPVFGKFTEQFVGTQLYGTSFTEHTLYLGWVPLILAFVAVRKWKKNKNKEQSHLGDNVNSFGGNSPYKDNFYIGFFIFLAIAAWLFSQPPWWQIGPIKIYMPSFFMYKILPMFRAYCRFGIVVMLAVAALAGFGLKFILEKLKTQKAKIAMSVLFCGLVLFEFWNWPPYKVIDVSKAPAVYYWLKEQPKDIVIAEYPLDINSPNEMYRFYQITHERKMINYTIPGTYTNTIAKTIAKLSDPKTAAALKRMGVKYVLVHKEDYLNTELVEDKEELNRIPKNAALKLIKSFPSQDCPRKDIMCVEKTGPVDVYEVRG